MKPFDAKKLIDELQRASEHTLLNRDQKRNFIANAVYHHLSLIRVEDLPLGNPRGV